ncbi:hypothetical protein OROGR_023440 [Orobanche gracilis]
MAFWGIKVKPGKPYILSNDERGRRLRVTQATLGSGTSSRKIILRCKVGDKKPVYLCSLFPRRLQTCALNLEFEEDREVCFSIIGSRSVHLTGFFCGDKSGEGDGYGYGLYDVDPPMGLDFEDVYDCQDEEEGRDCSDNVYRGHAHSPVRKSGEEIVDEEKPTNENGSSKRVKKKKSQSSMSKRNENYNNQIPPKAETSVPILESEDEDGFPGRARDKKSGVSKSENICQKSENKSEKTDAASGRILKRRGADNQDEQPARETEPHCSDQHHTTKKEVNQKKNKKKTVVQKLDSSLEYGEPDSVGMKESPVAEAGNDLKPSSEKKKEREVTWVVWRRGNPDGKKAEAGKMVSVRYTGKLEKDNYTFDSNYARVPLKFRLGVGLLLSGWDVGIEGMLVGEKRRLRIPPEFGFGDDGPEGVPPNAWLVYDMELVDVFG